MNAPVRFLDSEREWRAATGGLRGLLEMLEIKAKPFLEAVAILEHFASTFQWNEPMEALGAGFVSGARDRLNLLREHFVALGLGYACLNQIDRVEATLSQLPAPDAEGYIDVSRHQAQLSAFLHELRQRFLDDLEGFPFLALSVKEQGFYEGWGQLLRPEASAVFADSLADIEEAAKCLALGRYTASVFHLSRAMEPAVQKIGQGLGVTVQDKHGQFRTWGQIAADMNGVVKDMPKAGGDREAWQEITVMLLAFNEAYRNATMHPRRPYTQEQAEDVYRSVGAFMNRLATV